MGKKEEEEVGTRKGRDVTVLYVLYVLYVCLRNNLNPPLYAFQNETPGCVPGLNNMLFLDDKK